MAYVYKPYPKWITKANGERIIVKDAAEHALHTVAAVSVPEPSDILTLPEPGIVPDMSRDDLIATAENLGIKVDRRWSDARLRQVIDDNA